MANELVEKDGKIILNVPKMEGYIPIELFDPIKESKDITHAAVASPFGEGFKLIAMFSVRLGYTADADLSKSPVKSFVYPQLIETYPSGSYDAELVLRQGDEPEKYKVLVYEQGDIVMDANIVRDADNCGKFLDLLIKGKIPKSLRYEDVYHGWRKNFEINGANPGIPAMYQQIIIANLYTAKGEPNKPFRMIYGNDMNRNDYDTTNMRGIAASTSVFTGQTFEHMGRMLVNGVNMTRRGIEQQRSPVEDILSL